MGFKRDHAAVVGQKGQCCVFFMLVISVYVYVGAKKTTLEERRALGQRRESGSRSDAEKYCFHVRLVLCACIRSPCVGETQ